MSALTKTVTALLMLTSITLAFVAQQLRMDAITKREAAAQTQIVQLKSDLQDARANPQIITQYVDRIREVFVKGNTIIKEIPIYVTKEIDAACTVPIGFVRVHDAAAASLPPGDPRDSDAHPAGIALSTIATTVTNNYTTCHAIGEQLKALQDKLKRSSNVKIDTPVPEML